MSFENNDGILEGYSKIAECLAEQELEINHEIIFSSLDYENQTITARHEIFNSRGLNPDNAISWIEGMPVWGYGVAGVMIKAVSTKNTDNGVQRI